MENVVAMGVLDRVGERTDEVCRALEALDPEQFDKPSALVGWDRLTLVCHLRYGAQATRQMTVAGLAGRAASLYPDGRDAQRPTTLAPRVDEPLHEVVASLRSESELLEKVWASVSPGDWSLPLFDDDSTTDEPTMNLARLADLRLTEVEVHGTDLNLGLGRWAQLFGPAVLAQRVRRMRHWPTDSPSTWLFRSNSAPDQIAAVDAEGVVRGRQALAGDDADVVVSGPANSMVAVLLGRAPTSCLDFDGAEGLIANLGEWVEGP